MKRCAIYMRVSSDRQAKEGDSISAQRDALRKHVNDRADLVLAGEYLDDGVSGTKNDRDELQRLLSDVAAGKVDLIAFTKLDRWFRSIRHYTATQEILDRYGVPWVAIWEPVYDTTTPAGRLIVNQMMSIAQFEAENTGQRIRQVFAYKTARGEVTSGKVPPGYKIENKRLVQDDLAPAVLDLFQFYAASGCLAETTRKARETPGLPRIRKDIKRLLKNEKYIGRHHDNNSFCPPIVSEDLFNFVQLQLERNIKSSQKRVYLFSGLMRCGCCGRKMAGRYRSDQPHALQYKCPGHYNNTGVRDPCENKAVIKESTIEEYLTANLKTLIDDFSVRIREEQAPVIDAEKKRKAIQRRIDRLKELFLDDLISIDEYKKDRAALLSELDAIHVPAGRHGSTVDTLDVPSALSLYNSMGPTEKRLFWRSVISCINVAPDRSLSIEFL